MTKSKFFATILWLVVWSPLSLSFWQCSLFLSRLFFSVCRMTFSPCCCKTRWRQREMHFSRFARIRRFAAQVCNGHFWNFASMPLQNGIDGLKLPLRVIQNWNWTWWVPCDYQASLLHMIFTGPLTLWDTHRGQTNDLDLKCAGMNGIRISSVIIGDAFQLLSVP